MKQHDLLRLLCAQFPNIFTVTKCFKSRTVTVSAKGTCWLKEFSFTRYESNTVEKLSREVLREYRESKTS